MDINNLISQYGYAALVIGSVAEGETITLLGGVAMASLRLSFFGDFYDSFDVGRTGTLILAIDDGTLDEHYQQLSVDDGSGL